MITIIFGSPRAGKTALMTHLLTTAMFDRARYRDMARAIENKNENGFCLSIPRHCVVANYDVIGRKFGFRPRISRRINPFRLGYANDKVKTHFLEPYTLVGITEGQKYFNSRMSLYYPDWQSRWFEQHGHNNYDIFIDVQRPKLIDLNIRELAQFIEIVKKENRHDPNGRVIGIKWIVRRITGSAELEQYFASGKRDTSTYTQEIITCDYNVHACYNSQMCKPKFYEGHMDEDFDTKTAELLQENFDGYIEYLRKLDDELPKDFYMKKGVA
ncbi:MAG: zonular occludens toxin domain-containing protein [Firmicutes bacterium]|nr:zonular occludens toxin domain-containing protein [Bacillota bacterium]